MQVKRSQKYPLMLNGFSTNNSITAKQDIIAQTTTGVTYFSRTSPSTCTFYILLTGLYHKN